MCLVEIYKITCTVQHFNSAHFLPNEAEMNCLFHGVKVDNEFNILYCCAIYELQPCYTAVIGTYRIKQTRVLSSG